MTYCAQPDASLIIPTLNRKEIALQTVRHFLDHLTEAWELIIIDQSREPSSEVRELASGRDALVYHHIECRGLPNARNVGIEIARGSILVFVDDDVIPDERLLAAHLSSYASADVGAVAGRIVEAGEQPGMSHRPRGRVGMVRRINGRVTRNFDTDVAVDIDHVPGGNMSFRRELLLRLGGFDERFGGTAHLEETDVSMRIRRLGYRIRFQPKASLTHLRVRTGGCCEPDFGARLYWYGHNYMLFALKNLPAIFWPTFLAERVVKFAITGTVQRCPAHFARGLLGLWKGAATYCTGGGRYPFRDVPGTLEDEPPLSRIHIHDTNSTPG